MKTSKATGGYKVIDFDNTLLTYDVAKEIEGIYNEIDKSEKMIIVENLKVGGIGVKSFSTLFVQDFTTGNYLGTYFGAYNTATPTSLPICIITIDKNDNVKISKKNVTLK